MLVCLSDYGIVYVLVVIKIKFSLKKKYIQATYKGILYYLIKILVRIILIDLKQRDIGKVDTTRYLVHFTGDDL